MEQGRVIGIYYINKMSWTALNISTVPLKRIARRDH